MRNLLHIVFAVALTMLTASAAAVRAEPAMPAVPSAEQMDAARDLFTLIFDHAFGAANARTVAGAWPGIEDALRKQNPTLNAAALADLRAEYTRFRLVRLREATKDLPAIYARLLTTDEMRALVDFYRTPPGQKMLEMVPQIMTEAFATVLPRVRAVNDESHSDFMKLLRQRGLL
jgi:hypothetical protein